MKTKSIVAALAGMVGLLADAGEFGANGCFARWDETTLTVGNGCFTRTYGCADADLKTRSFAADGFEWIDSARVDKTGAKMSVTAEAARRSSVGADGLKVVVTAGAKTRTLWLFASVPGVILEDPSVIDLSKWKPDERLYNNVYRKLPYYLAGADRLHLKPLHVKAFEYVLQDMTDIRNELVEVNSWLLMTREEPLVRSAPVVAVEDTFTGRGLVFLRLAPLPNDRPAILPDFSFAASEDWSKPNQVYLASVANGYPVAELAYAGGEAGRTRALHAVQRALRPYRAGRDGLFLSNTWGDGHRDARINADFMMAEVKAGGELGVDVVQIDDGWQSGKSHNSALIKSRKEGVWGNFRAGNPDFWKPDPEKFPGGLGPIVAAAKERGMGFGLWFGPDKTDDYAAWELDAKTLVDFYRAYGVKYFKIDGIIMNTEAGFANIRRFFDRMLVDSNGEMTFDLDVTGAAKRPSYFGLPDIGPLFMENRYIGGEGSGKGGLYWPHFTLRNVWTLSKLVNPVRLRAEICNPLRGQAAFGDDPLAPKFWRGDTLFASVMVTSPLGWFEISELDPKTVAEMKPLVATWKRERANLHGGETLPVGAEPDGLAWTGFATRGADGKSAYALLFRELSAADAFALDLGVFGGARFSRAEVIGGRGTAALSGDALKVRVPAKLDFIWVKLTDGCSGTDDGRAPGRCEGASGNLVRGPYPLLVTPWTEDAKLDVEVLAKEAEYVNGCGVGGIIWPTAGEVIGNLSAAEFEDGLRALAKRAVEKGFSARITAVCPGKTSADAVARVKLVQQIADETGAKMAILARPPDDGTNQTVIAAHYRALAQVTRLPVIIQTFNGNKAAPQPDVDLVVKLSAEYPDVYGYVKEESPGLKVNGRMAELLKHKEIKTVLSGWGGKGWMFQGTKIGTRGVITQRPAYAGLFARVYDLINAGRTPDDPELASTYAKYLYMCNLGDTFTETDDNFRGPHLYVLQQLGIFRNRLTRDGKGKVTDYAMTDLEKLEIKQRMRYCGLLK